jgi:hypothetical protein
VVTWSQIDEEMDGAIADFRKAYVAIFRKYEGQETDETDGSGRTVKVTAASFAKRFGIAKQTFHDWISREGYPDTGRTSQVSTAPSGAAKPRLGDTAVGTVCKKLTRSAQKMREQAEAHDELREVAELLVQIIDRLTAMEPEPETKPAIKAKPRPGTAGNAVKAVRAVA